MEALQEPFDCDPPERLVDGFQEQLDELLTEFKPLLEKCRSLGCTGLVLLCSSDPLTNMTHAGDTGVGDHYARVGLVYSYLQRNAT